MKRKAPKRFDINPIRLITFISTAIAERQEKRRKSKSHTNHAEGDLKRSLMKRIIGNAASIVKRRAHPERSAAAPLSFHKGK